MAFLKKSDLLARYRRSSARIADEGQEKAFAAFSLDLLAAASLRSEYDIFLSHSYDDARIVKQIRDMLADAGYTVYVDWLVDGTLDRSHVTSETAKLLRSRMDTCKSLIYVTSPSARQSVWMPWELGYMDARTQRVSIAPVLDERDEFSGREYLGLYPYLDLTLDHFYIHASPRDYARIGDWLRGGGP
jgi:hypothetical protein